MQLSVVIEIIKVAIKAAPEAKAAFEELLQLIEDKRTRGQELDLDDVAKFRKGFEGAVTDGRAAIAAMRKLSSGPDTPQK